MTTSAIVLPHIPSAVTDGEGTALGELARGATVLEAGAHYGRSTVILASTAAIVHSVDWHGGDGQAGHGDSLPQFLENLDRYKVRDKVVVHLGRFETVLPALAPESFDVAFLDGFHDDDAVARDIRLLWPLIKPGGCLALHDYGRFGVAAAVDAWILERHDAGLEDLVETLAVVRKLRELV